MVCDIYARLATCMNRTEIVYWLREENETELTKLWRRADSIRRSCVGDEVHLRGLIEISNHCRRNCLYCGIRKDNKSINRYRMSAAEIIEAARSAVSFGYGTVVLQGGEDAGITKKWMDDVIRRIKGETGLAVTLSLSERNRDELEAWRLAGADRYLLRFETSNPGLFRRIHPILPGGYESRIELLKILKSIGYETGSGVMIGIPGETYDDLANDIELFDELSLDMIGVGPYIPHPGTPLCESPERAEDQVPNSELMTYKVIALARILCPLTNIPSTTALATLNTRNGREHGLMRGANVVMPNITPPFYREKYEIYPGKACVNETAEECNRCLAARIAAIGRTIGTGRGDSRTYECKGCEAI